MSQAARGVAAAVAGSESAEEVLARAAAPPLARFGERVAALVAEELRPLFDAGPLHATRSSADSSSSVAWLADVWPCPRALWRHATRAFSFVDRVTCGGVIVRPQQRAQGCMVVAARFKFD